MIEIIKEAEERSMQKSKTRILGKEFAKRCFAMLLVIVLLMQSMVFSSIAAAQQIVGNLKDDSGSGSSTSGIGKLNTSEITAALRNDILKSMNEQIVKKIEDNALTGPVGLIITFSDDSIVSEYSDSRASNKMTYDEFKSSKEAKTLEEKLLKNQNEVLARLEEAELIDEIKYNYVHLLNGAFVSTTYENVSAIASMKGVQNVMISNTYLPLEAVNNPVDVYDTGIFNSGSVEYTGKGTLVAILDTGCDYSHTAFTTYVVKDPAYDRDYVESKLEELRAYGEDFSNGLEAREVYYGNLTGEKIVFGYDYADKDPDIMPFDNSHGTHVAGIIAGKDDRITGVAIDAQLAIMKVFSDYKTGAEDGDVLAALEDSIVLGVDAINMSLGAGCGFTFESDGEKLIKNDVYDRVEKAGISLIVAASNDYSSAMGGEESNTNKTDNPDSGTIGTPSTYHASMSVASINGQKDNYMLANGETPIFFTESNDNAAKPYDFFKMLGITEGKNVTYEYVAVPGVGMAVSYTGIDVRGKIALVKRGDITFEEKVQFAEEAGAIAVVIYNNIPGAIHMTIGNHAKIPAVSISKDEGDVLAAKGSGTLEFSLANEAGPFMSDFSSWGPSPDLSLKPDITAHGGNILSAIVGNDYEEMSGTSMASPNMCGITVLIRQYVAENFEGLTNLEERDLVNQLCMSTATIAKDKNGNPYSPRKQGAGIADIRKATTTPAYLFVDGSGRTKLELGDDPERTGVYKMKLGIKNVSASDVSYKLGNIVMTESISTSEPDYVSEIAYLLSNSSEYAVEGDGSITDGIVTVAANKTAYVTVTVTLSAQDKSYLNSTFENGMYVEGYLTFDNTDENGVDLNAPFLAFYGDWGEAPIFDLDFYEVETEAHNDAIDDDEKIKADYYATTPLGTYYYDYVIPLGSYVYKMDEALYDPIPATRDKAAISYYSDSISSLYAVYAGLLRGAKEMYIEVKNSTTGEIIWKDTQYNCYKSYYRGGPAPYAARIMLDGIDYETNEVLGDNNTKFEVTMSAKLDWKGGENVSDTYSFSFYIDYQAPTVSSYSFRTEYDKTKKENRYYLDLMVYDNHYAMSCRPVVVYDSLELSDDGKTYKKTYSSLSEFPVPVYQETIGTSTKVTMEITDYLDKISKSSMPNGIAIYLDDYALNTSLSYIPFPGTENADDIEFEKTSIDASINETIDLTKLLVHKDTAVTLESDYLKTLKWDIESGNDVVKMKNGQLEAIKTGTAVITVTSDSWIDKSGSENVPIYKKLTVNVGTNVITDNPLSGGNVKIENLEFSHYKTLFAHNTDIDFSEIGKTGNTNYFGGNYNISCYPAEKLQLFYSLEPWNLDPSRYSFKWKSSNPKAATVDENGVVTAEAEGKTRISLEITVDGKQELLAARVSLEVKSEFIIESRTLVAYKGKGGDVVIPDDEGILYIGKYAFSHFDMDNEKEVEKDKYGYYEIDDKKTPIGNTTVTSVTIPAGVETIQKYAFYNCSALTEVKLPESCITVEHGAFEDCKNLKNVNFDNVKIVGKYAFYNCEKLNCADLGGANTSKLYAAGNYSFANTGFTSLKLPALSRIGDSAFEGCAKLASVELGERTRISKGMFKESALNSVTIWSDTVSDEAFMYCDRLTSVTIKNDLTYLGMAAFAGCHKLKTVELGGEVENIAAKAFYGCSSLTSFTLPEGEVALGDSAFASSGLSNLTFSKTTVLDSVGVSVFATASNIRIDISKSDNYKLDNKNEAIYSLDGKTLVMAVPTGLKSTFTVPAAVTTIADGAFSSLSILHTVNFESGSQLTSIGDCAFSDCKLLSAVLLPSREITIGDYAFSGTEILETIDLSHVKSVGEFAFAYSGLGSAQLTTDGVNLGGGAFYNTPALESVTLGKDAIIGEYCFRESKITEVDLNGDAKIGNGAFYGCTYLSDFDFADVTGKIGDDAFWSCTSLTEVNAPKITEIGKYSFADCVNLASFSAAKLEVIGDGAFSTITNVKQTNKIVNLSLPSLKEIGEGAFYFNKNLKNANLPSLNKLGNHAFDNCTALESISFSADLKNVTEYAFFGCINLKSFDVSHVTTFEEAAFYGVPLPKALNLNAAENIGLYAFYFDKNATGLEESALESVSAPNLTYIGIYAFYNNENLKSVSAPKLTTIDKLSFAGTAIEEFEVGDALTKVELHAFQKCNSLKAFFVTVNGEKKYDGEFGSVKLVDGALYLIQPDGYNLASYPAAKTGDTLVVVEGTNAISSGAAFGNKNITSVKLPSTLKTIGDYAFFECDNLKTVTFRSYHAPVLEGSMLGETIKINDDNLADFPGFEKLYKYDYYYRLYDSVTLPLYYRNFIDVIGSKNTSGLTAVLPDNCEGYDTLLYSTYFTVSTQTSGATVGKYATAFIDATKKLPEVADRFDRLVIENAILAYNALLGHAEEKVHVDNALIEKYNKAVSEYNVDVVENLIAHLFDMYKDKHSFEKVKEARAAYMALSDADRAKISNADRYTQKLAELNTAFGTEVNFDASYEENLPAEAPTDDTTDEGGLEAWVIIVIIAASVIVAAGAAVLVIILVKKNKKSALPTDAESSDDAEESLPAEDASSEADASADNEAEENNKQ